MSEICGRCGVRVEGALEQHRCEMLLRTQHPQSTTALVLGILGLVLCLVLAPVAWIVGGRAVRAIDAAPARWDGRGSAQAGRVLGIVGTALWSVVIVATVVLVTVVGVLGNDVRDTLEDAQEQLTETDPAGNGSGGADSGGAATDYDRDSAIRAAETAAVTIVAVDHSRYDAEVDEAAGLMTPEFASEYRDTANDIKSTFVANRTVVQARSVGVGVVGADAQSAQLLVFLNQTVDRRRAGKPETVVTPFKILMGLDRVEGEWLVSAVDTDAGWVARDEPDAERREILDAAGDMVTSFVNFDYRDPDATFEAVLAGSTGTFAEQYRAGTADLKRLGSEAKSTMTAEVEAAGLVSSDDDSATVILATRGQVTNEQTGFEPEARNYRIQVELVLTDGQWLTSDLQYVELG